MKNREKYKDELIEACKNDELHVFYDRNIKPFYDTKRWVTMSTCEALVLAMLWFDEEYVEPKPEIDWSKVAVDTPILVKDFDDTKWKRRYFAGFGNGFVYAWSKGCTSWSVDDHAKKAAWAYAKLVEEE